MDSRLTLSNRSAIFKNNLVREKVLLLHEKQKMPILAENNSNTDDNISHLRQTLGDDCDSRSIMQAYGTLFSSLELISLVMKPKINPSSQSSFNPRLSSDTSFEV